MKTEFNPGGKSRYPLFILSIMDSYNYNNDIHYTPSKKHPKKAISISYIRDIVADYLDINKSLYEAKTRKGEIVKMRQIAMYFSKLYTKASLATIGYAIGGKDHSTVLHACRTVRNIYETDKYFKSQIDEINQILIN